MDVVDTINSGKKIEISSDVFNKKYEEYKKSKDISTRVQLLKELLEIYENYLKDKATIEYFK